TRQGNKHRRALISILSCTAGALDCFIEHGYRLRSLPRSLIKIGQSAEITELFRVVTCRGGKVLSRSLSVFKTFLDLSKQILTLSITWLEFQTLLKWTPLRVSIFRICS